jgi:hypothetical protein
MTAELSISAVISFAIPPLDFALMLLLAPRTLIVTLVKIVCWTETAVPATSELIAKLTMVEHPVTNPFVMLESAKTATSTLIALVPAVPIAKPMDLAWTAETL